MRRQRRWGGQQRETEKLTRVILLKQQMKWKYLLMYCKMRRTVQGGEGGTNSESSFDLCILYTTMCKIGSQGKAAI